MRTNQPQTIYLSDYQVPAYLVDQVDLRFELFEDGARVHSTLTMRRNPEAGAGAPLELNGDSLKLESLVLNGSVLPEGAYQDDGDKLAIPDVPAEFQLVVVTWIEPQNNTRLEGLYKSSSMFCTQCEAEGFRCITYYPDRPDVMARFRTRVEADKGAYPVLLSNGNPVEQGDLDDGRHFVTWEDPFPKPAYLFALVAGDLLEKKIPSPPARAATSICACTWSPATRKNASTRWTRSSAPCAGMKRSTAGNTIWISS